jgi:predicted DNA-binding transcriptional regulator AlpA
VRWLIMVRMMAQQNEKPPIDFPVLLDVRAAAALLGISTQTLRLWRRARRGPDYVRINCRVHYPIASINRWLEKRTVAVEQ